VRTIYYEEHGNGDETIVFAHGLLWSGQMYEAQVAALKDRYRCITFDFRGQGQSEATATGYDMDTLAQDALALIKERVGEPVHFVGLSMGGFVGMRLAIHHPEWLLSLSLLETSADPEPKENLLKYKILPKIARIFGMWIVAPQAMKIMFGKTFLTDPARAKANVQRCVVVYCRMTKSILPKRLMVYFHGKAFMNIYLRLRHQP
jgi:3-oxoadipate enol-lactonase